MPILIADQEIHDFSPAVLVDRWMELMDAAAGYLMAEDADTPLPKDWPWTEADWKPAGRLANLVRAKELYQAVVDYHLSIGSRFAARAEVMVKLAGILIESAELGDA